MKTEHCEHCGTDLSGDFRVPRELGHTAEKCRVVLKAQLKAETERADEWQRKAKGDPG